MMFLLFTLLSFLFLYLSYIMVKCCLFRDRPTHDTRDRHHSHVTLTSFYPILHSLHVLAVFFSLVFIVLFHSHPFRISHPPPTLSSNHSSVPQFHILLSAKFS